MANNEDVKNLVLGRGGSVNDREAWTELDERNFQYDTRRRERVLRSRINRLAVMASGMPVSVPEQTRAVVADWLRQNAGLVRDVLHDFDDGARCANSDVEKIDVSPYVVNELLRSAGFDLGQSE